MNLKKFAQKIFNESCDAYVNTINDNFTVEKPGDMRFAITEARKALIEVVEQAIIDSGETPGSIDVDEVAFMVEDCYYRLAKKTKRIEELCKRLDNGVTLTKEEQTFLNRQARKAGLL